MMMNIVYYKLCIVTVIIIIDLMLGQASAQLKKTDNEDTKNIDAFAEQIQMIIYKGNSIYTANVINVPITQPEVLYNNIDQGKSVVIYVHGVWESPFNENSQTIVGAHLERGEENVWIFDWSKLSFYDYESAVKNSKIIAQIFAIALTKLVNLGFNIDNCHLVAHSLGAQIAGLIWKYMEYTLHKITGLDPANPGFSQSTEDHIDNRSARFVHIIHADEGFYGFPTKIGTADFYPNDGKRPQPGCTRRGPVYTPIDLCSHHRAWRYYAESVKIFGAFRATQCDNFKNYLNGNCLNNRVINMGYGAPTNA
ncbi:hypothetical protein PV328_002122 [Microctonus aethiopoides]|uniref:phospholipase A1 n=1 Tax=Microctonus aethiopoides TaxID=144406 RepID=A0AA39FZ61_9HYME|nr:hypothetical protein PV328_002122 [Microctonus aethiopoides]